MNTTLRIAMTAPIAAAVLSCGMAPAQAGPSIDLPQAGFEKPKSDLASQLQQPNPEADFVQPKPINPGTIIAVNKPPVVDPVKPKLPIKPFPLPDLTTAGSGAAATPAEPEVTKTDDSSSNASTSGGSTTPSSTQQAAPSQPVQQPKPTEVNVRPKVTVVVPKQPATNLTVDIKAPKPAEEDDTSDDVDEPVADPAAEVVTQEAAAPVPTQGQRVPMPVFLALGAAALGVAAGASYRAGQRKTV